MGIISEKTAQPGIQQDPKPRRAYKQRRVRLKVINHFSWKTYNQRGGLSNEEQAFRNTSDQILSQHHRPKVRSECQDGLRPCPWVSCRYHLGIEITPIGTLKVFNNWDDGRDTCALDVAEAQDGMILRDLGRYLYMTRERARQIEILALMKYKHAGGQVLHETTTESPEMWLGDSLSFLSDIPDNP